MCAPAATRWTVDYRVRQRCMSRTSKEFGTPEPPGGWTPLSPLIIPLDSTWRGPDSLKGTGLFSRKES